MPGAPWAEITASADLRVDSLCGASFHQAALLVRVGSIIGCQNYYYCCFVDFDHNEIRVGKMAGACATGNWTGSHVPKPLKTKTWYHLDFKAGGNAMTCTLAGGNLPSPVRHTFTDGGTPYASGSAGMGTFGLQASFDNFVVRKN